MSRPIITVRIDQEVDGLNVVSQQSVFMPYPEERDTPEEALIKAYQRTKYDLAQQIERIA